MCADLCMYEIRNSGATRAYEMNIVESDGHFVSKRRFEPL